jgi:hypothetical protein
VFFGKERRGIIRGTNLNLCVGDRIISGYAPVFRYYFDFLALGYTKVPILERKKLFPARDIIEAPVF